MMTDEKTSAEIGHRQMPRTAIAVVLAVSKDCATEAESWRDRYLQFGASGMMLSIFTRQESELSDGERKHHMRPEQRRDADPLVTVEEPLFRQMPVGVG
jgi:hypothetical protein